MRDFAAVTQLVYQSNVLSVTPCAAGAIGEGADCLCQVPAGTAQLRLRRQRDVQSPRRRAVQVHGGRGHRARALQGRAAGPARRDRRAHAHELHEPGRRHGPRQGRQAAHARRDDRRGGSPGLPNVPTMAEAGLPGYEFTGWMGVFAPARTPQAHRRAGSTRSSSESSGCPT